MRKQMSVLACALLLTLTVSPRAAHAAKKADIDSEVKVVLAQLYESTPVAKELAEKAKAVLVFPSILKAGLIIGAQGGNGALLRDGKTVGYYNTAAASYGLQAGVQTFGYAMFFMTDEALAYLDKSSGWEVGVGPSVVLVDKETVGAFGKNLSTSTLKDDIYAFIFSQKGLMAGLGLQGSKITRINPEQSLPVTQVFRNGQWRLCDRSGWPDNESHRNVLAWCWELDSERRLIVLNFSGTPSQALLRLPRDDLRGRVLRLSDPLSGEAFERSGDDLTAQCLFVSLAPWSWHFLRLEPLA